MSSNVRALLLRREGIKEGGKFPSNVHGARVLPIWAQWLEIEKKGAGAHWLNRVFYICKLLDLPFWLTVLITKMILLPPKSADA